VLKVDTLWPPARIARASSRKPPASVALPLFALFYQVEIRHPQILKRMNRHLAAHPMQRHYNAIVAILELLFSERRCAIKPRVARYHCVAAARAESRVGNKAVTERLFIIR
jgi:hypothetical protein